MLTLLTQVRETEPTANGATIKTSCPQDPQACGCYAEFGMTDMSQAGQGDNTYKDNHMTCLVSSGWCEEGCDVAGGIVIYGTIIY